MARNKKTNLENKQSTLEKDLARCISDKMNLFNMSSSASEVLRYFCIGLNIQDRQENTKEIAAYIKKKMEGFLEDLENLTADVDKVEIFYILIKSLYNLKEGFKAEKKQLYDEHMVKVELTAKGLYPWLIEPIYLMPEVKQFRKERNITSCHHMPYERMEEQQNAKK